MSTAPANSHQKRVSFVEGLRCRECGNAYDKAPIHVCEFCFGPLEVAYDYAAIGKVLTRALIESRAP
jgi:threonine synthase